MPLGPDELATIAGLVITAAGGGFGIAKLQTRTPPVSPGGNENGDETLRAIEKLTVQNSHILRVVNQLQFTIGGLTSDVDGIKHDMDRLKPVVQDALGRLAVLERQSLPNQ